LRQQRIRKWSPASGQPFVLLIIDELADVIAYQPDTGPAHRNRGGMTATVELLAAICAHLTQFELPAISSMHAAGSIPAPQLTVQLAGHE
jgi:hypothetical protein